MMSTEFVLEDCNADGLALARRLISEACHATLAVMLPGSRTGAADHPHLSRILCQADADGCPVALLSGIALHSRALAKDPRAALMIAPAQPQGDPMSWPRLSLQVIATQMPPDDDLRARWLQHHPRSKLYLGLPDFRFWRLQPVDGLLNAGFGAACRVDAASLLASDMATPPQG